MTDQKSLTPTTHIHGFTCTRVQPIPELRSTACIFTHDNTGARLLHLFNEDPNNLFSIAFRTPVSDCTGVPHILEHSVLGGSRKFPLKDPFQELLKGSLQTFLNALTYPDKTMYPVSSQVETDFFNLVNVYCDAVFHPLLTENTFRQEGWHFDLDKEDGDVGIKGIVYNEMKGVFSDFASHVERRTISLLFPDTSYFFESGGEPEHITDLTHKQFRAFHASYYHPSNSFIVLYGNIPSEKTLGFLNDNYLAAFDRGKPVAGITPQPSWQSPRRAVIDAPAPDSDDGFATVAMAWKCGLAADPVNVLVGKILYRYFMGTESSPLKRALIDSGLGEDLDDICGFETEFIHGIFSVGLRKSKPEHADEIEKLVLDTLQNEIDSGLDDELLEGAIRLTEFRLREITDAGRFPFNLLLAERCMRSWLYDGDPLAHLAFEKPLSIIRDEKNNGNGFFVQKIRELLIENRHFLRLTVRASSAMGKQLETKSAEQAKRLSAGFSAQDKKEIFAQTQALIAAQKQASLPEAVASLPRLSKADLPKQNQCVPVTRSRIANADAYLHTLFTSGIVYTDFIFDFWGVPLELHPYLPLYLELLTSCGAAGFSYEAMSKRISLSTGGIDGSILCETKTGDTNELLFGGVIHAKSLASRTDEMLAILSDLFLSPDFSNVKQIKDILFEMRNNMNASVLDSGHQYASVHAASRLSQSRALDEALDGITQLRFLDICVKSFKSKDIIDKMKAIHSAVIAKNRCTVSITADDPAAITQSIGKLIDSLPQSNHAPVTIPFTQTHANTGIEISASVNFVAKAWKLESQSPQTLGHYFLLSRNLSTGYLWDKVRVEGGAYGGMAMAPAGHPIFACASYRDPNIASTLSHFETGLSHVAAGLDKSTVDQSIIGSIGRLDAPRTPHEKGFGETVALLCGRTNENRQEMRDAILSATPEDLAQTAQHILDNRNNSTSVLGSASAFDKAEIEQVFLVREDLLKE